MYVDLKEVGTTTSDAGQSSTAQTSPPSRGSPRPSRSPSLSVRKRLLSGSDDTKNRAVPSSSERKYRKAQISPPSRESPRPSRIPIRYKNFELKAFGGNVASGRLKRSPTYSKVKTEPKKPIAEPKKTIAEPKKPNTVPTVRLSSFFLTQPQSAIPTPIPIPTPTPTPELSKQKPESTLSINCTSSAPAKSNQVIMKDGKFAMDVTIEEAVMIRELRKKSADLRKVVKGNNSLDTAAIEYTCNVINTEVMSYSKKADSLLIDSSAPALENFSLQKCWDEFQEFVPTLTSVVSAACIRKHQEKASKKILQDHTPLITTVIGKCLGVYSRRLTAMKAYYGLMISNCGITNVGLDRMAKLGDAIVRKTVSGKLKQLAKPYDVVLKKWDSELANYGIVLDNVDTSGSVQGTAVDNPLPQGETSDSQELYNHQTNALPRHYLKQISTALDEVHKRGYRIALLAAHKLSNNTDDIITMYKGDITLKTKLQLQVVFKNINSELPDGTMSKEEHPTFFNQEKISNNDNTGMRCQFSVSDIIDTVITDMDITDNEPESSVEDIKNCPSESTYHDSLPCHDSVTLVKTEPPDYEYIVQRDSQAQKTIPVTLSVVRTEMPQCSSDEIIDLKPTDIELHLAHKECGLQVHELSNHCTSGPDETHVKTEPSEVHHVVHHLGTRSEQEQTTKRPSTPTLESASKKLRQSPQIHASSHIMMSDSPRSREQPLWSKDFDVDL